MIDVTKFEGITKGEWGVTGNCMVVTPPPDDANRMMLAGETFTARRIAFCDPSYYVPEHEAQANAHLIAAAPHLLAEVVRLRADNEMLRGELRKIMMTIAVKEMTL